MNVGSSEGANVWIQDDVGRLQTPFRSRTGREDGQRGL